jgi:hypothetical protein
MRKKSCPGFSPNRSYITSLIDPLGRHNKANAAVSGELVIKNSSESAGFVDAQTTAGIGGAPAYKVVRCLENYDPRDPNPLS